jgi:hypothetical protein
MGDVVEPSREFIQDNSLSANVNGLPMLLSNCLKGESKA